MFGEGDSIRIVCFFFGHCPYNSFCVSTFVITSFAINVGCIKKLIYGHVATARAIMSSDTIWAAISCAICTGDLPSCLASIKQGNAISPCDASLGDSSSCPTANPVSAFKTDQIYVLRDCINKIEI